VHVDYTLEHLGPDTSLRGNIATGQFNAGHMVYIDSQSLDKLKQNVAAFMDDATKWQPDPRHDGHRQR
jgi:carboxypeptidase C (cathepsin A)